VRALQARLGLEPGRYVAMCPGGGGDFGHVVDANRVFADAAGRIAAAQEMPVVLVLADTASNATPEAPGVRRVGTLPNGQLMGLLRDATVVAVNGGSLLLQCMAQGLPIVAAPIAGDQAARIRGCAREGFVHDTSLDPEAMTAAVSALLRDGTARSRLQRRLADLGLRNRRGGTTAGPGAAPRRIGRGMSPSPSQRPRLRLLHVILSRGFAGSERAAAEACNALARTNEVALVVRRDHRNASGASIRDYVGPDIAVYELPPLWRTRAALADVIDQWRPSLIHTHLRRGTRYVAQLRRGVPHVATLHIDLDGRHYLRTDGLCCISPWQVEKVVGEGYAGAVFQIPNSLVSHPRISAERRAELRGLAGATTEVFLVG
jgi:hypothetical protein